MIIKISISSTIAYYKQSLTGSLVFLVHDAGYCLYHELNDGLVIEHHLDSVPYVNDQQDDLQKGDSDHVGHLSYGFHKDLLLHPEFQQAEDFMVDLHLVSCLVNEVFVDLVVKDTITDISSRPIGIGITSVSYSTRHQHPVLVCIIEQ